MKHARPRQISEALSLLANDSWLLLAGGTDFYPAAGDRPITDPVLDITALAELRSIAHVDGDVRIGALATWTDVIRADLPDAFDALKAAGREVGSVQIQNKATIAGNLCNASPAADGVPPLLVLDACVELRSAVTTRRVPLVEFITGNRATTRRRDELVCAVIVPAAATTGRSSFLKLGARRYLVISIAMVAARLAANANGLIEHAAIAVGACSAVAKRLPTLERALLGRPLTPGGIASAVTAEQFSGLSPIDDVRASASYRRAAAQECVLRALCSCVETGT